MGVAVAALARALSESTPSDQEYTFIVNSNTREWLEPHIFGPCRIATVERPATSRMKSALKTLPPVHALLKQAKLKYLTPPRSDGYVESKKFDLVHFLTPAGYITNCPTIYQPHDLQHLHFPQFFSKDEFAYREKSYRALCDQATFICVHTEWCKNDVVTRLKIPAEKIAVIKWGCVLDAPGTASPDKSREICKRLGAPEAFFVYPAVTWPHKNHECVLRALRYIRDTHGEVVNVCFTGRSTDYRAHLDALTEQLDIASQVHFLGFVTPAELQALFAQAIAMIYPSKFEGFGLPILEAFQSSLPVICSRASCLPEVAHDAAIYFDPESPEQLAACIMKILGDEHLRSEAIERGLRVVRNSSFQQVAADFQHLYRLVAEGLSSNPDLNQRRL